MTRHTPLSLLAEFGPLSRDTIARSLDLPWVDSVHREEVKIAIDRENRAKSGGAS